VTATRNSGSVHDSDATAYDTPNTNIDHSVRRSPPRSSLGRANDGWNPASMAMPSTVRATPITIVASGMLASMGSAATLSTTPMTVNTTTNPAVTTALMPTARNTTDWLSAEGSSIPRKYDR
jgi:hypothetical protein